MQINIHEAKTHFSKMVERALSGEEVVISRNGTPLVTLVPVAKKRQARTPGLSMGAAEIASDFDAPLEEGILSEFEK
jgi:prevent-host-death family protein